MVKFRILEEEGEEEEGMTVGDDPMEWARDGMTVGEDPMDTF